MLNLQGKKIGNYRVERLIGEGGMSAVWLGRHHTLDRRAAIKVIAPELLRDRRLTARFRKEADVMAALDHPNIVKLYDYVEDASGKYLILEYAEGMPLDKYIREKSGPIPEDRAQVIFLQILRGVQFAHDKGIVHRDIKPSNVIFDQESMRAKILDFGIAKLLEQPEGDFRLTATGARVGTPIYMSPEQIKGGDITPATDVYALGMLFYVMLTAQNPWGFLNTEFDVQEAIVRKDLPPMREYYPGVSDRMERIVRKATAKKPELRFPTAEAFSKALMDKSGQTAAPGVTSSFKPRAARDPARPASARTSDPPGKAKEQKGGMSAGVKILLIILAAIAALTLFYNA